MKTDLEKPIACSGADRIRLTWSPVAEMTVRFGSEIHVRTDTNADLVQLRHLVSGIGMGLALYQRGFLTLHAGAVAIGGRAVAFVGPKGVGKSTLVAALAARGHLFISDDVVAVDVSQGSPRVLAGAPSVNLWPDSAAAAGCDTSQFSRIFPTSSKLTGTLAAAQPTQPVPLGAIVILGRGTAGRRIAPLNQVDAFARLVGHSHAFRWVAARAGLTGHLASCQRVLTQVPVFQISREDSLSCLSSFVELIEESLSIAAAC